MEEDEEEDIDDIIVKKMANGLFNVVIGERVQRELRKEWWETFIVKLLGRKVSLVVLKRRLEIMWGKNGSLDVIDLGNDFFLVRFYNSGDLDFALMEGPWKILDHYLTVQMWKPDFNPSTATIDKIAAWIHLPELAIEYYHRAILEKIANIMGRKLKVDTNTAEVTRGKFARLCAEVDLTQPLVSQYMINGVYYTIEYEGLHQVCFECGRVGIEKWICPEKRTHTSATPENREEGRRAQIEGTKADEGGNPGNLAKGKGIVGKDGDGDMYRPWTIVQRPLRGRQTGKMGEGTVSGNTSKGQDKEMTNIGNQSRFIVLQDLNPYSRSIQNQNDVANKVNEKKDKEVENITVHQKGTYLTKQPKQSNRQTTQPNNNKPT
ncbi:uncharacterized protein LOC107474919 [Arachis duranensis]|uniref:Uncharacterized protein LOC107474919 n=1 Tax=Arachis duranensis TaxID=130453 RepID=A0A6P4CEF1_ARADU|nr:uncharacterized protein LOC107474919 [Arachis duranensis]